MSRYWPWKELMKSWGVQYSDQLFAVGRWSRNEKIQKGVIEPVPASMSARGVPAGSEGQHGPLNTVQSMDLLNLEVKMGMDSNVLIKKIQKQNWAFEKKIKFAKRSMVWKDILLTVKDSSVVMLDKENDGEWGYQIIQERRGSRAMRNPEPGFLNAGYGPMEAVADWNRQAIIDATNFRDLSIVVEVVSSLRFLNLCSCIKKKMLLCMLRLL